MREPVSSLEPGIEFQKLGRWASWLAEAPGSSEDSAPGEEFALDGDAANGDDPVDDEVLEA
ncbi:MAG TPA: hypothetical protein VL523_11680 [Terriglobia bacterium]|nr:hypothetical protein [Terriglobia bacterium]